MNKQKQQSMQWLTDALLTLMGEKDYREISITEICTRANVFFSFWKAYKDFLLMMHQQNLIHIMLFQFNELLPNIYVKYKAHLLQTKDKKSIEYVAIYNAGGFWNLLIRWLEDGCTKTPEDMSAIVNEVLNFKQ